MLPSNPDEVALQICKAEGFTFVGRVGSGAFKHTYHVKDKSRSVALKLYQKKVTERSEREIEAMKRCDHAHIAKFIALRSTTVGDDEIPYLLEEFLSGGSLSTRVGTLRSSNIARLGLLLSGAIEHIASQKLVHRDLKPDNIMFRDSSLADPVIVDFGLVRDLSADSLTATFALHGPGTAMFAAPEQLNNQKHLIRRRTDQFGLGVTLAYALFQVHPYARAGDSIEMAVSRVINCEEPAPEFQRGCNEAGLGPLVRMVKPYPVERFPNGDLLAAWEAVVTT